MSATETKIMNNTNEDGIELRLSDTIRFLKNSRKSGLIGSIILLIIGILYAFSRPDQYSAQVTVMPEFQSRAGGLGGLSSLAGLAGIDIGGSVGNNVDAIRPDIYPDILQSVPFALQLLKQPVYSRILGKRTTLQKFIEEKNSQSWISKLIGSNNKDDEDGVGGATSESGSNLLQLTKAQESLINYIHATVFATFDRKTGIITVSATLPDPVVAATVARLSLEYLTTYITSYRTEKARNHERFLTKQVKEAERRYQLAEFALSNYRDKNRNLYLNTAKIEEQHLQADLLLAQNVFSDLSKQFEQAKIKVSEEAPVFKVLEPARIPLKKSAPKRSVLILGFAISGFFLGMFIYGIRQLIVNLHS